MYVPSLNLVPFFGHIISDQGVKPDLTKKDVIKNMRTPTSKHEILSFLGLCNYLSTYVPDMSSIFITITSVDKEEHCIYLEQSI